MKRGGPLQRKTPLNSGSSLRSSKPPAEGEPKPTKPRRKTGKHVGKTKAQDLAKKRSDDTCEPRIPGVDCAYWGSDFHHRILHGQGGLWLVENGLRVCRPCHLVLTNTNGRRAEFEHYGWIIPSQRDPEDRKTPAEIEAFIWHENRQDWFLLLEDGTAVLAPWPEGRREHPDELGWLRPDRLGGIA